MKRKQVEMILISAAALLALVVCAVIYSHLSATEELLAQVPSRQVVVATRDIPEQEHVEVSAIRLATVSAEMLPRQPITRLEDAVGKVAIEPIYRGDILHADRVVSLEAIRREAGAGNAPPAPSMLLGPDQVLFVLPPVMAGAFAGSNRVWLTTANAVRHGDYMDLVVTWWDFPEQMTADEIEAARGRQPYNYLATQFTVQDLPVVQVGLFPNPDAQQQSTGGPESHYLAVIVNRETALQLKWLKDMMALGQISGDWVLRSPNNPDLEPSDRITVYDITRRSGVMAGGLLPEEGELPGTAGSFIQISPLPIASSLRPGPRVDLESDPFGVAALGAPAIIPEADTAGLVLAGLAGLGALALWRRRGDA